MHMPDDPEQRSGATSLMDWESAIETASVTTNNPMLSQRVGSPENVYTNESIDQINDCDHAAIVKQARDFVI